MTANQYRRADPDWLAPLFRRRRFGMHPGLDGIQALLQALDHPEQSLAVVHVAGTNGKGTVAALTDSVLRAAGYRSGRFTSPHLLRFNERFTIDGVPVGDDPLEAFARPVLAAADRIERTSSLKLTFFECATAMAFYGFRSAGLRLAVIETGMGGRLDATNVAMPLVSAITRIGLDHTQWLGATIEAIAAEKAGIIKSGRPVVLGAMPAAAAAVIEAEAARRGAPCLRADRHASVRCLESDWTGQRLQIETPERSPGVVMLPLAGAFQAENAATALTVCDVLSARLPRPIEDAAIREGFAGTRWPGRFQCVGSDPVMVVDGAHNPEGIRALLAAVRPLAPPRSLGCVFGLCADKDAGAMVRLLAPQCRRAWAVRPASERAADPDGVASAFARQGVPCAVTELDAALAEARSWARDASGIVLVCGSLFLVGEVLERIGWREAGAGSDPNETLSPDGPCARDRHGAPTAR